MQDIPYDASHVPIDYDDPVKVKEISVNTSRKDERREQREQRAALEKDVAQLQKKLMIEVNMRNALNRGLSRPLGSLPRIYASLPVETRELLLEVAVLEEEIMSLEKQVIHLGREIENEVPATDKETICQTPHKMSSLEKADILGSPLVSPKESARINLKPSVSPRKSPDQKSNFSKPSLSGGQFTENKSSPSKVSISPRNSLDNGSSMKSPTSLKDSSKPKRISTIVPPQKSQIQRNSLLPKAPLRNSRDFKSRRLSFTKKEPHGVSLSAMNTVPFIPMNLGLPKEGKESTPPVSPAPGGPNDVKNSFSGKPPRIKTENGNPPMTGHARLRRKDPINNKGAPVARTLEAPSTNKPPGQGKGPVDLARRTPRLPRQPLKHGTISTLRTMGASTATREQRMDTYKTSKPYASIPLNCDSNPQFDHQKHGDAEAGEHDSNNVEGIPPTDVLDGDQNAVHLPPDNVKASRPTGSPERDTKLSLEQVTDSVLLSEEVVKLLETIYENLQEKQPPLAFDSGSSSQVSMSASISSASPDDYDIRGGANIKFRLDGCHTESLRTKRSASMKCMRDCYPGEIADTMDPYSYLSRGNISNRIGYHERLMS